jgi:hypothetical protein
VGKNGFKASDRKEPVLCCKPDKKSNQKNKKNRVCEFPVPAQIEKLVSGLMAQAAASRDKYGIWDEIHIRKGR